MDVSTSNERAPAADEARQTAAEAGLHYTSDRSPGIRRTGRAPRFRYRAPGGRPIGADELRRIRALAIPPAWRDVWICPRRDGHLQATGRDARGRKQYRYHRRWRQVRDENKFDHVIAFGRALPALRRRLRRDLALPGLPREKVLATVVLLLEKSLVRVGNDEYTKTNHSYGLTTLKDPHAKIHGSTVRFVFRGKSGVRREVDVRDPRIAAITRRCRDLPGQELFQYLDDDGTARDVGSSDVNAYLREITGTGFTAKDFRTWAGTVLAATALAAITHEPRVTRQKRLIKQAVESVAKRLGNTPTVCRACYIHPAVIDAWIDGDMLRNARKATHLRRRGTLPSDEAWVLRLLQRRLEPRRRNGDPTRLLRRSLRTAKRRRRTSSASRAHLIGQPSVSRAHRRSRRS